jgi:hypothetical protein
MDKNKFNVGIVVTIKDGRYYFDISADDDLETKDIRSILAGAVALSIRGEKTPKLQGQALKDVINYLESEFIDADSFTDVHTKDE